VAHTFWAIAAVLTRAEAAVQQMKVHFVKRILRSPKWVCCLKLKHYCLLAKHDRRSDRTPNFRLARLTRIFPVFGRSAPVSLLVRSAKHHPNGRKSTVKDHSTITQESSSPNGKQEDVQFVFECGAEMISTGRSLPIDRRLGYISSLAIAPAVNTAGSDDFSNPHHQHRFDIDRC
jgi:hypothetical protein